MKISVAIMCGLLLAGCAKGPRQPTAAERYAGAVAKLTAAKTEQERFYALNDAAIEAVNADKPAEARAHAAEQAALLPKYKKDWNYGNAVQDINIVMGRLALREGRVEAAEEHLLLSAGGGGSPQLNSFGPNMILATELLRKGRRDSVIKYLGLCGKFWTMDRGWLKKWADEVAAGRTPDFNAHLTHEAK